MIDFKVVPDNGDAYEVTAGTRDLMKWEKANPGSSALQFAQGTARLSDLYAIAHIAAKRQGLFKGTLDEFEDSVELEFEEADEAPLATR